MRITAEQVRRLQYPHKEFLDELNRIYENIKFFALSNGPRQFEMEFYYEGYQDTNPNKEVLERIRNALELDGYKATLDMCDITGDVYLTVNWE